jgi:hypothetical protein
MEISEYWELVDDVLAEADDELDGDEVLDTYAAFLADLPPDELADISRLVKQLDARATTWPVLGACAVLLGTGGDAEFEDFRGWLISRGRETFEKVVASPDALADVVEPGSEDSYQIEGWVSAADVAYVEIMDEDPDDPTIDYPVVLSDRDPDALDTDDEELLAARYPRLVASLHEPEPLVDDEDEDDEAADGELDDEALDDATMGDASLDEAAHLDAEHDDPDDDPLDDEDDDR